MATQFKLYMLNHIVEGGTAIRLTVGVYPATVDPTAVDGSGNPVNTPLDQINVDGTLGDTPGTWEARTTAAFGDWCIKRSLVAAASAGLAATAGAVLTVTDPTGN